MTNQEPELLPCPWGCKEPGPKLVDLEDDEPNFRVLCPVCGASPTNPEDGFVVSKKMAILRWNTRREALKVAVEALQSLTTTEGCAIFSAQDMFEISHEALEKIKQLAPEVFHE